MAKVNEAALWNAKHYASRLEIGQVRLLRFEPTSVKWSFETYCLTEAPPYTAVSYTWGPNEDTAYADEAIISNDGVPKYLTATDHGLTRAHTDDWNHHLEIDGENYRISRNVHQLADLVVAGGGEALAWIDALSINQADDVERSAQVSAMGQVFEQAASVLVWLGTDDRDEAETVIEMCELIQTEYKRQLDSAGRNATIREIPNILESGVLESMGLPPAMDDRWNILARFWDRRWFHRTWIVQEVTLSKVRRMWWGDSEVNVAMLVDVSSFILQSRLALFARRNGGNPQYKNTDWYQLRRRIGETLAKIHSFKLIVYPQNFEEDDQPYLSDQYILQCDAVGGPRTFDGQPRIDCMRHWANMLETNRTFDASDPRDYIYGTIGIIDTAAENRGWTKTGVIVDYTKSVAEVYADAAKRIMETSRCVSLVSLAQDPQMRRQRGLPSWVPDFSARGEMPILLPKARRWKLMPRLYECAQTFQEPTFEVQDDLRILTVKAIRIDKIEKIGESHHELCNGGMWEKIAHIMSSRSSFIPNESKIESLWRTMVANSSLDGREIASSETATLFKAFVALSLIMATLNNPSHLDQLPTWEMITRAELDLWDHDHSKARLPCFGYVRNAVAEMERILKEVEAGTHVPKSGPLGSQAGLFGNATECMFYRRILLTKSGHLGFGPMSSQPGDEIWLLPDMPLPTLLRRVEPSAAKDDSRLRAHLLGEAYVHGDPDVEAFRSDNQWHWIDIT